MDSHTAATDRRTAPRAKALDLRHDHQTLRELLDRFEQLDDYSARRDVMQLVMDLFEVHSAIESLTRKDSNELVRECEAVYELMEQVEASDPKSQLHFARGLELSRAFEAYVANEESTVAVSAFVFRRPSAESASLLRERERLVDYAERLLRPH